MKCENPECKYESPFIRTHAGGIEGGMGEVFATGEGHFEPVEIKPDSEHPFPRKGYKCPRCGFVSPR